MALDPLVIRFASSGLPELSSAFARVATQVRRFEEQATRERKRGSQERERTTRQSADAEEKAYQKLVKDVEKQERQRTKDTEREEKRRESIRRRSSEYAGRIAAQQAKDEVRQAERATREIEREEERKMRVRIRSSEMAGRAAAREAAEEIRAAERAAQARGRIGRRVGGLAMGSVGGLASAGMGAASLALGIGGGFALANAAHSQLSAERTAALLVNAGTTNGVRPGSVNQALGEATAQSKALGIGKDVLLQGALTYSQNARGGDFQGALANMGFFAKVSKVTGADINDIASAAGTLQSQNQNLDAPAMQQLLLNTLAQSHQGSMSMVDAAKQFGILGSTRAYYKGDVAKNQQTLIGLGQIARAGGDVGEAGTFVKDIATEAGTANKKFRKMTGRNLLHIDAKTGQLDSPEQVVEQVLRATGGNINQIGEVFGQRGSRLFGELAGTMRQAGGGEKGIAAAMASVRQVTGATMTPEQLEQQNKTMDETPAARFQIALNNVAQTLGEKLEPKFEHFATETLPKLEPVFEKIIDEADKLASWFADNPIKGVGAVVLAAVTKDIAGAGIGAAAKAILSAMLQQAAAGAGVGAGGGILGKAGWVGAAGAAGAGIAIALTDADVDKKTAAQRSAVMTSTQAYAAAMGVMGKSRRGTVTAADLAAMQQQAASMGQAADLAKARIGTNEMGMAQTGMAYLTGHGSELRNAQTQEQVRTYQQLKQAQDAATKAAQMAEQALSKLATTAGRIPPVQSGAPTVPITDRPVH
jgi:flagellar biosynthesis GTPase FlhF